MKGLPRSVRVVLGDRRAAPSEPRPAAGTPICRAASTSLYLDPRGDVRACCQSELVLGNVGEQSLSEIWEGPRAERLREALDEGDLSLGCSYCEWAGRTGDAGQLFARRFDELPLPDPGGGPTQLELALSNTCNLQCVQCNGELSSAIRSQREGREALPSAYGDEFFAELEHVLPGVRRIELFGGEPLLARESRRVLEVLEASGAHVEVQVTTNATVWPAVVQRLARTLRMSFVVSLDGASAETYEAIRVGASWTEVRARLDELRSLTQSTGASLSISHCLMVQNWWELPELLRLAAELDAHVGINAVLSPLACSLYHLPVLALSEVVAGLRAQDESVQDLPDHLLVVWTAERARLEAALADAEASSQHAHLGGPPQSLDPQGVAGDPFFTDAARLIEVEVEVEVEVDGDLAARSVTVVRDRSDLPPVDLDARTAAGLALLAPFTPRATLDRRAATYELRQHEEQGVQLLQRRTLRPSVEGSHLLQVEQRCIPTVSQLAASLRQEAGARSVSATIVVSPGFVVVAPLPPPELQERLGLRLEEGSTCLSPADVLQADHRQSPPVLERWDLDPVTERVRVRCSSGLELTCALRTVLDGTAVSEVHIVIAGPVSGR